MAESAVLALRGITKGGLKTAGRVAAGVLGGVVAVYEIASLAKDLTSDHDALVKTRQVVKNRIKTDISAID